MNLWVLRMKDSAGWHLSWTSPRLTEVIEQVALNAKVLNTGQENCTRMVAAAYHSTIQLWSVMVSGDGSLVTREIGQLVVMNPSLLSSHVSPSSSHSSSPPSSPPSSPSRPLPSLKFACDTITLFFQSRKVTEMLCCVKY